MKSITARPFVAIIMVAIFLASCATPGIDSEELNDRPYVVMVSFDGFRHDYVEKWQLPNFKRLIAAGAACFCW